MRKTYFRVTNFLNKGNLVRNLKSYVRLTSLFWRSEKGVCMYFLQFPIAGEHLGSILS